MKQYVEITIYLRGGQTIQKSLATTGSITDDEFTESVKEWKNLFGNGMVNVSFALERWGLFIPRTDTIDAVFFELKDVK